MNPHQLELFYHVAKSRGVTRATRQMPYGIQQPSVSSQVNALERDLGVTLYQRRPFKLTTAGEELLKFVAPFFGRMSEVREKIQGAAQIRIGASPNVFRDYLPPVLEAVQRPFPLISLKPNELICQLFQQTLTKLGHSWLPKIEMDSLDLIEKYVEEGFGAGLGIRAPLRKLPSTLRAIELPNFPRLKMGVVYR